MATAIETATALYLYSTMPSPTATQPAQQRVLLLFPSEAARANATFLADVGVQGASIAQDIAAPPAAERTAADRAVAQLLRMEQMTADWDGDDAAQPKRYSLEQAREFVRSLAPESVIPEPALHADGHAILFLHRPGMFAELEFLGRGRIGFYARLGGEEWADELDFDGYTLPEGLSKIGFAVYDSVASVAA